MIYQQANPASGEIRLFYIRDLKGASAKAVQKI